jgi:hypothetical protein
MAGVVTLEVTAQPVIARTPYRRAAICVKPETLLSLRGALQPRPTKQSLTCTEIASRPFGALAMTVSFWVAAEGGEAISAWRQGDCALSTAPSSLRGSSQ